MTFMIVLVLARMPSHHRGLMRAFFVAGVSGA
jgi:hypothetical protein